MKKILVYSLLGLMQLSFANPCGSESGSMWINDRNRNSRPGGFVADGAVVEEYVFIAPTAAVCGSATITGNAKINGNARVLERAIVQGAQISGDAVVYGDATIESGAIITANAKIGGDAVVKSGAIVRGFTVRTTGTVEKGVYSEAEDPAIINAREERNLQAVLESRVDDAVKTLQTWLQYEPKKNYGQGRCSGELTFGKFTIDGNVIKRRPWIIVHIKRNALKFPLIGGDLYRFPDKNIYTFIGSISSEQAQTICSARYIHCVNRNDSTFLQSSRMHSTYTTSRDGDRAYMYLKIFYPLFHPDMDVERSKYAFSSLGLDKKYPSIFLFDSPEVLYTTIDWPKSRLETDEVSDVNYIDDAFSTMMDYCE